MSTNHDETCDCISQTHPAGIHLCYIYNDDEERRQVMARFVNTGIDAGELVAYFADVEGSVEEYLEGMGIHLPTAGRNGQLRTLRAREVYAPDGQFLPDRMLDNLRSFHDECKDSLYPAVRITGETTWTLNDVPGCDRFIEYEARINSIL
ncbi:MAG TPA: MEDS domain-containing protein, partial [Patescibacteria group bacterium]|nr:MEDS domain-containing protein [Patescibacteria group bacterium]